MPLDPVDVHARFVARTLPKSAWTHEAHLAACWVAQRDRSLTETTAFMRRAIQAYNEAVGTPNTDTDGYHETLTRYYVAAVAAHSDDDFAGVLADPACSRHAPLRHWSRERLFSVEARRSWVPPDEQAPPFPVPD